MCYWWKVKSTKCLKNTNWATTVWINQKQIGGFFSFGVCWGAAGIWPSFLVYLFGLLKGFYIHTRLSLILVQKCSASIQEKVKDYPWVETQVNSAIGHVNVTFKSSTIIFVESSQVEFPASTISLVSPLDCGFFLNTITSLSTLLHIRGMIYSL